MMKKTLFVLLSLFLFISKSEAKKQSFCYDCVDQAIAKSKQAISLKSKTISDEVDNLKREINQLIKRYEQKIEALETEEFQR